MIHSCHPLPLGFVLQDLSDHFHICPKTTDFLTTIRPSVYFPNEHLLSVLAEYETSAETGVAMSTSHDAFLSRSSGFSLLPCSASLALLIPSVVFCRMSTGRT